MYADKMTYSMKYAIDETQRRRRIQMKHNEKHGITPKTINKKIHDLISATVENDENNDKAQTVIPKKMTKNVKNTIDNIEEIRSSERFRFSRKSYRIKKERDMLFELKAEG